MQKDILSNLNNDANRLVNWPPPYTLKKHPRARYVKLKATLHHGLEIITPPRFSLKNIPEILETNKNWIVKKLAAIYAARLAPDWQALPNEITFHAIGQSFRVQYIKTESQKVQLLMRPNNELVLFGAVDNKVLCKKVLTVWVKVQAENHLLTLLRHISIKTELPYKSASIRAQRSRWGSCSSKKAISLNYKLIFLPRDLMQHIMIHELCHTKYLNHSDKFWQLVATFDPRWEEHDRKLRNTDHWIPSWL